MGKAHQATTGAQAMIKTLAPSEITTERTRTTSNHVSTLDLYTVGILPRQDIDNPLGRFLSIDAKQEHGTTGLAHYVAIAQFPNGAGQRVVL